MTEKERSNILNVACHEAAHAVVGYMVGLTIMRASIEDDKSLECGFNGEVTYYFGGRGFLDELKGREIVQWGISVMAGPYYSYNISSTDDYDAAYEIWQIGEAAKRAAIQLGPCKTKSMYKTFRRCAKILVNRYRKEIDIFAEYLVEKKEVKHVEFCLYMQDEFGLIPRYER